jgi:hypothetical protein
MCTCGTPLLARYDVEQVAAHVTHADIATRQLGRALGVPRLWPCQPQLAPQFSFYVAPHSVVLGLEFSFDLAPP